MSLDFSGNYDGSFKSVAFWIQYESGFSPPDADDLEDTAKLRVPGSDTTIIQTFGRATRTLDLPIAINAADLPSLRSKRGQSGTLVYFGGSVTAFLDGLAGAKLTGNDLAIYNVTLKFTL